MRSILINLHNSLLIKEVGHPKKCMVAIFYIHIFLSRAVVLGNKIATNVWSHPLEHPNIQLGPDPISGNYPMQWSEPFLYNGGKDGRRWYIHSAYRCCTHKLICLNVQATGHTESDADFVGKFPKGSVESW